MPVADRGPARQPRPMKRRIKRPRAASPRSRAEGRRRLLVRGPASLLSFLAALMLATLAVAWYASGQLMAIRHVHDTYPLRIVAADGGSRTVMLTRGPGAAEPGSWRLA